MAVAALGLAAAPVAAESFRAGAPVDGSSQLAENSDLFLILGALAIVAGVIVLAADDDDDALSQ
ncbi:hypothetical protein [Erythrobacter litoralis]|nr:hypothetical protein [Erythrobacter litoralis]